MLSLGLETKKFCRDGCLDISHDCETLCLSYDFVQNSLRKMLQFYTMKFFLVFEISVV